MPDAQRFLVVKAAEEGAPLTLVVNWTAELERRRTEGVKSSGISDPLLETLVDVEGTAFVAIFAKIAVNDLRRPGNPRNELATVLRQWFGPDAGLPGTNFHVVFRSTTSGWALEPVHGGAL